MVGNALSDFLVGYWWEYDQGTTALSGSTTGAVTWVAVSFVVPGSPGTTTDLNSINFYVSSVVGTVTTGDLRLEIRNYTSGSTSNPPTTGDIEYWDYAWPTAAITGAGWYQATRPGGFVPNGTYDCGQRYWLMFRNVNATPSANYITLQYRAMPTDGSSIPWGASWASKAATGATWSLYERTVGLRLNFANGLTWSTAINLYPSLVGYIYGSGGTANIAGVKFTTPANYGLKVNGVSFVVSRGGTGCSLQPRILDMSNNVIASGHTYTAAMMYQSSYRTHYFALSSTATLQPNTTYRFVLVNPDGAGTSTNHWRPVYMVAYDTTEMNSIPLGAHITYSANNGSTWTDYYTNRYVPVAFVLHLSGAGDGIYVPAGSGGGIVPATKRGMI